MKLARALMTGSLVAASFVACAKDPVGANTDAQVAISVDSLAVNLFTTEWVSAGIYNTVGALQYTSLDQKIATVNAIGGITGVGVGSTHVIVSLSGRPDVRDSVRVRVYSDSCGGARPDFGGVATVADRNLFSYDVNAPLNLQKTVEFVKNGVEVSGISFSSPDGGLVTGLLFDPVTRSGLRPGVVLMHGHPSNARNMTDMGQHYAQHGAVVISIDAPFARRAGGSMTLTPQDSAEQIQVIKDLQRAVDVLRARPNVDDDRIAFVGVSWGGATGALLVGIERRLKAAALVVGHAGQVSLATGPQGFKNISSLSCARRVSWIRAMTSIEPTRFIGQANIPLLLQNGRFDEFIPVYLAEELHAAAPQPKTILWYNTGHNLNQQAVTDLLNWLREQIGLE
jgi:uncharacterized protein